MKESIYLWDTADESGSGQPQDGAEIWRLVEKHRRALEVRAHEANKGTYGRLLIIAGSNGMAGAAYLAGLAAFRCGIGMVRYLGPSCNRTILQTLLPEAMYSSYEQIGREHV